ncbi:MAG: hypothetical protein ACREJR_03200, partial [Candidatus Rokuibacteriota bacterium]
MAARTQGAHREQRPAFLRGVRLPGSPGPVDVELADGRIEGVRPAAADGGPRDGGLLCLPAFADLHVHADRAFEPGPRPPRSLADAIELAEAVRATSGEEEVAERGQRLLDRALLHGSVHVRSHADTGPTIGLRAVSGLARVRAERRDGPELEIVAFASADLDPASAEGRRMLAEAADAGADLLGAFVAFHPAPDRSLDALLELAGELDLPVDVHLDENATSEGSWLE